MNREALVKEYNTRLTLFPWIWGIFQLIVVALIVMMNLSDNIEIFMVPLYMLFIVLLIELMFLQEHEDIIHQIKYDIEDKVLPIIDSDGEVIGYKRGQHLYWPDGTWRGKSE